MVFEYFLLSRRRRRSIRLKTVFHGMNTTAPWDTSSSCFCSFHARLLIIHHLTCNPTGFSAYSPSFQCRPDDILFILIHQHAIA